MSVWADLVQSPPEPLTGGTGRNIGEPTDYDHADLDWPRRELEATTKQFLAALREHYSLADIARNTVKRTKKR